MKEMSVDECVWRRWREVSRWMKWGKNVDEGDEKKNVDKGDVCEWKTKCGWRRWIWVKKIIMNERDVYKWIY